MKPKLMKLQPLLFALLLFFACGQDSKPPVTKNHPDDPFKETMVESQFFDIPQAQDTVLEGKNGLVIAIPEDAFVDANGNVVKQNIQLELAEPSSFDEIVLSNLTTQSNGKQLSSKAMFYINATADGQQLSVNPNSPIYVEIPSNDSKKDVMLFKGERDKDGKINWVNPTPVVKYLKPVNIMDLDFLPPGFADEVKRGMPFRSHETADEELTDSLYYSLTNAVPAPTAQPFPSDDGASEPVALEAVSGENWSTSTVEEHNSSVDSSAADTVAVAVVAEPCGIDPASIKALKDKKFRNTLLATKAFEQRMRAIHQTCDNTILDLYINNLHKNLWEIDEMAANQLSGKEKMQTVFEDFAAEKLTNVEKKNPMMGILAKYYVQQLKKMKERLSKLEAEAKVEELKKTKEAQAKREEYRELLVKREKYRMNKFGFELTDMGWYNGAVFVEDLEKFILEVRVNKGDQFDRVHTYIYNPKAQSLFAMVSDDNMLFDRGYWDDKHLLMWKHQTAEAIVIAYKGEQAYYEKQEWTVYSEDEQPNLLNFDPQPLSKFDLKLKLAGDMWRTQENKIKVDLEYQKAFHKEKKRQKRLHNERQFMGKLWVKAYYCCSELANIDGETLFKQNCATCHTVGRGKLTGPDLLGVSDRIPYPQDEWFGEWVRNSQLLLSTRDPYAEKIYEEYNRVPQPSFEHLSKAEIQSIKDYIDNSESWN